MATSTNTIEEIDSNTEAAQALNKVSIILAVPGAETDKWLEMLGDFFCHPEQDNQEQLDPLDQDSEPMEPPAAIGKAISLMISSAKYPHTMIALLCKKNTANLRKESA